MRGCPGTGKSRFLRTVGADQENLIVSSDSVRQMLAATVMAGDGSGACSRGFGGRDGKLVWDFLHECVRQRARQGSDIFLDTCGITWDKVAREAAYCVKLGYELTVIDMQGDAPLDAVLDMQELRKYHPSYVDRATVAAMWEAVREGTSKIKDIVKRRGGTYLTAEWRYNNAGAAPIVTNASEMARIVRDKRANNGIVRLTATDDHPVVFVGDIHSDADRLNSVFQKILNRYGEGNATVVLLGDLFDRGPDPVGTKDLLRSFDKHEFFRDLILVEGNHDFNLRRLYADEKELANSFPQTRETIEAFKAVGWDEKMLRARTVDRMVLGVVVEREGRTPVFACHGGVNRSIGDMFAGGGVVANVHAHQLIYGTGDRDTTYYGRSMYFDADPMLSDNGSCVIVHGHRNRDTDLGGEERPILATPGVVNLEQGAGTGGPVVAWSTDKTVFSSDGD